MLLRPIYDKKTKKQDKIHKSTDKNIFVAIQILI